MASVTFIQTDSDRGFVGQTVEAFWNSISHVPLLSVGMNCALGPEGIASAHRGTFRHCADLCQRLSECRPAEPAVADRFSGNTRISLAATPGMGAKRLAQHRRRLLRHHAAAHQGHCRSRAWFAAAPGADGRTLSAIERPGGRDGPSGFQFSQHRRTHERRRFAKVRATHQGRRFRGRAGHRPPAGRERRAGH